MTTSITVAAMMYSWGESLTHYMSQMRIKKLFLIAFVISSPAFLIACHDELGYLKDEVRYDCNGETLDSKNKLNARYIVNKKSGGVHEFISYPSNSSNRLALDYLRNDQLSATEKKVYGAIELTNQVTITPSMRPIGFSKWVGGKGAGATFFGECTLVKLDRKEVLKGRREYQALEKEREGWFKSCEAKLRRKLKDPSSYSYVSHSTAGGRNGHKKYVDIKYRAKNSYGATVLGAYKCTG